MAGKPTYEELEQRVQELEKDAVENQRIKKTLQEREARFRLLYERAPLGYQSLDCNGNFIEVNQAWLETLGYTREEVIGKNFGDFLHPDWVDHFKNNFPRFKAIGEILGVEFEMEKKDGSHILVSFNGKIGHDEKGEFKQTHCILHNITEQKLAEEKLIIEKTISDEYTNSLPGLFYVFDEERFVKWNKEWESVSGYSADEIGQMYGPDFFEGSDKSLIADRMMKVFREGVADAEAELVTKQGKRIPYYFTGSRKEINGTPHLIGLGMDISERKRAEETIANREKFLDSIIEQSPFATWISDENGTMQRANPALLKMLNLKESQLVGVYNVLRDPIVEKQGLMPLVRSVFDEGETINFTTKWCGEETDWNLNGSNAVDIEATMFPIFDATNKLTNVVLHWIDVTKRKQAEEALHEHIHFLENLEKINKVIKSSTDMNQIMHNVIETVFQVFECDRTWLLYPCDPNAPSCSIPVESYRPEYPGAKALDLTIPMTPPLQGDMMDALNADGPVSFGPGNEKPMSADSQNKFSVQSQMFMSIHPRIGDAWMFGMHQCSHERIWTDHERRLFSEIGRRIADSLSSFLFFRDLTESEEKYRSIMESMAEPTYICTPDFRVSFMNPAMIKRIGYDATGERCHKAINDLDEKCSFCVHDKVQGGEKIETEVVSPKDERAYLISHAPIFHYDGSISKVTIYRDITDRRNAEDQVLSSLKEKEVLLREIHHRVKNNMQVIISLLRMHSRRVNDPALVNIFDECRDRVTAMSLIHESLYQSEDLALIDFEVYLKKLCQNLSQAHGASDKGIEVMVKHCNVALNIDQGIAVGIMISELITNSFKHAFHQEKGGEVLLSLTGLDEEYVELVVQDNGKGLSPEIDIRNAMSLGLQLAVATATQELGGSIEVERNGGTRFVIRFKCLRH